MSNVMIRRDSNMGDWLVFSGESYASMFVDSYNRYSTNGARIGGCNIHEVYGRCDSKEEALALKKRIKSMHE
jgi:hypothetical protein